MLRPGDCILVTKLQTVTEADVQSEDDGAGVIGKVDMGHFPVGTERARFDHNGTTAGWVSRNDSANSAPLPSCIATCRDFVYFHVAVPAWEFAASATASLHYSRRSSELLFPISPGFVSLLVALR